MSKPFAPEEAKIQVVAALYKREAPAREIAENSGVRRETLYGWKRDVLGVSFLAKPTSSSMDKVNVREEIDPEVSNLEARIKELELQDDILLQVNALLKKSWHRPSQPDQPIKGSRD